MGLGVRHAWIKPRSPQLNVKVEWSRRSDDQEFHQLLGCRGGVDLKAKLEERERFHNLAGAHGAHGGETPCEVLRKKL